MSDYQAIYDAVRSRIHNGDVGQAIENAIGHPDIEHHFRLMSESIRYASEQMSRPSVLYRPELCLDGNSWCALYGENIQTGVCAFGKSPEEAMTLFDEEWRKENQ